MKKYLLIVFILIINNNLFANYLGVLSSDIIKTYNLDAEYDSMFFGTGVKKFKFFGEMQEKKVRVSFQFNPYSSKEFYHVNSNNIIEESFTLGIGKLTIDKYDYVMFIVKYPSKTMSLIAYVMDKGYITSIKVDFFNENAPFKIYDQFLDATIEGNLGKTSYYTKE